MRKKTYDYYEISVERLNALKQLRDKAHPTKDALYISDLNMSIERLEKQLPGKLINPTGVVMV